MSMAEQGKACMMSPLRLGEGQSSIEAETMQASLSQVEAELAARQMEGATVVCWQVHAITWGRYADGKLAFAAPVQPALIVELRAFTEKAELHLRRKGALLVGRLRQDGAGEAVEYIDTCARLWGEYCGTSDDGWLTLRDKDRKLALRLPRQPEDSKTYGLLTRNYLGCVSDDVPQMGYVDSRFVAIVPTDVEGDA